MSFRATNGTGKYRPVSYVCLKLAHKWNTRRPGATVAYYRVQKRNGEGWLYEISKENDRFVIRLTTSERVDTDAMGNKKFNRPIVDLVVWRDLK